MTGPRPPRRIFLVGATGTIGRATAAALVAEGYQVVCLVRPGSKPGDGLPSEAILRSGEVTDPLSIARDGLQGERFMAVVSCLASRTGAPKDAWAVDYQAHMTLLSAAKDAGIGQVVLLSAICVQKPKLAFQQAF